MGIGPDSSLFILGGTFGWMKTIGVYEHNDYLLGAGRRPARVHSRHAGMDDVAWAIQAKFSVGAELRLGMIGLPRIGLTTKISAGLQLTNDGNNTDIAIGTQTRSSAISTSTTTSRRWSRESSASCSYL